MDGVIYLTCVHAQTYKKKDGSTGTKLFVPVGSDCFPVFVQGDQTARAGTSTPFVLKSFNQQLRLSLFDESEY